MHDLAPLRFDDARAAVMVCRRTLDWLPTAHQFAKAHSEVVTDRIDAERDQRRALAEAAIVPAPPEVASRYMDEIRQKLAGAKGPLARSLREEFVPPPVPDEPPASVNGLAGVRSALGGGA